MKKPSSSVVVLFAVLSFALLPIAPRNAEALVAPTIIDCPDGYTCTATTSTTPTPIVSTPITSTYPVTPTDATVMVDGSPTLELVYDANHGEAALKASLNVSINGGTKGVNVYKDNSVNISLPTTPGTLVSISPVMSTVDNGGRTVYVVPAGQTVKFQSSVSANPKQMFAGTYYASLKAIGAVSGLDATTNYVSLVPGPNTSGGVIIVGEVSPYITSISPNPIAFGQKMTITGQRLTGAIGMGNLYIDNLATTILVDGSKDGTTLFFTLPATAAAALTTGYHSLYVRDNLGGTGNSNNISFQVGTPVYISDATVTFPSDRQRLELRYDSAHNESTLTGLFDITINGGTTGVNVYKTGGGANFIDQKGNNANVNSKSAAVLTPAYSGTKTGVDEKGQTFFIIPAKRDMNFTAAVTVDPRQMFAGTYYATLVSLFANRNNTTYTAFNLPVPPNQTVTKTIVGEVSPYINSVSSSAPGQNITILGQRLSGSQVFIDGVLLSNVIVGGPSDGSSLSFTPPASVTYAGSHTLYVKNDKTGASNRVGFEVRDPNACYTFNVDLQFGSTGADVVALQTFLIANNYHIPAIESGATAKGTYEQQTVDAVKLYQDAKAIPRTGFVGPLTRQALNTDSCGGGPVPVCPIGYVCTTPSISSLSPVSVAQGTQFTIYGANFLPIVPNSVNASVVMFSPTPTVMPNGSGGVISKANVAPTYVSPDGTKIIAITPTNLSGDYYVFIDNIVNGVRSDSNTAKITINGSTSTSTPAGPYATISLDSSSPPARTVLADSTNGQVLGLPVLIFDLKGPSGQNATLNKVAIQFSIPGNLAAAYLYQGSTIVASASVSNGYVAFSNLNVAIPANTTIPLTVKVDVTGVNTGSIIITPSVGGVTVVDTNGNALGVAGVANGNIVNIASSPSVIVNSISTPTLTQTVINTDLFGNQTVQYTAAFNLQVFSSGDVVLGLPGSVSPFISATSPFMSIYKNGVADLLSNYNATVSYSQPANTTIVGGGTSFTVARNQTVTIPVVIVFSVKNPGPNTYGVKLNQVAWSTSSGSPTTQTTVVGGSNSAGTAGGGGLQQSLTVLSPNGGESFRAGDTVNIRWNTGLSSAFQVGLQLQYTTSAGITYEDGLVISNPRADLASYQWVVPAKYATGMQSDKFKMRAILYGTGNTPSPQDYSDNYFTIASGSTYPIVCPAGYTCTPVGGNTTPTCPAGYTCTVVTYNCPSGYTCTVSKPTQPITVISPNGGEVWAKGTTQAVKWITNNIPATANVTISLKNASTGVVIPMSVSPNTGYTTITTTAAVPPDGKYYVVVKTDVLGAPYDDSSDGSITIGTPVTTPTTLPTTPTAPTTPKFEGKTTSTVTSSVWDAFQRFIQTSLF